jgi:hypothetical protein
MGSGQRVPLETAVPPDPERSTRQARPVGQGLDRALSSGGELFSLERPFIFNTLFYLEKHLRLPEKTATTRPAERTVTVSSVQSPSGRIMEPPDRSSKQL